MPRWLLTIAKGFFWLVLACGIGGLVFVAMDLTLTGLKFSASIGIRSTVGVVLSAGSALLLWLCYRIAPNPKRKAMQVSLADLAFALVLNGAMLTTTYSLARRDGLLIYLLLGTSLVGLLYVSALLAAGQKGVRTWYGKAAYATALLVRTYGLLAFGALIFFLCTLHLESRRASEYIEYLRNPEVDMKASGAKRWVSWAFRVCGPCLILGTLVVFLIERGLPKELPPPRKEDVTSSPPDGTKGGA